MRKARTRWEWVSLHFDDVLAQVAKEMPEFARNEAIQFLRDVHLTARYFVKVTFGPMAEEFLKAFRREARSR